MLKELSAHCGHGAVPPRRRHRTDQAKPPRFGRSCRALRAARKGHHSDQLTWRLPLAELIAAATTCPLGPMLSIFLAGLAPSNKVPGGKILSSRTRRSGGRAAALLTLAAVAVGRTNTALGAFYRRLPSRIGKAKAVTATARKIAMLFSNAVRPWKEFPEPRYRAGRQ